VYPFGDVVIKVAFATPEAEQSVAIDAAMNPVARGLGVRTPALIAFDDSREIMPASFAIYQRVRDAVTLGEIADAREAIRHTWEDTGRNLARVHAVAQDTPMPVPLREFRQSPEVDPRPWAHELRDRGLLEAGNASWLLRLLDDLAPAALADIPLRLCHGDVNASNILLLPSPDRGVVLIDWAGAGWLDPAWDFVSVSLAVVPWMLAGHRAVAPLPGDETAEARILWCQVQTRLFNARAQPDDAVARAQLRADMDAVRAFAAGQGWA